MRLEELECKHCKNCPHCAESIIRSRICEKFIPRCGIWIDINEKQPSKWTDVIAVNYRNDMMIGRIYIDPYVEDEVEYCCECCLRYEEASICGVVKWTSCPDMEEPLEL